MKLTNREKILLIIFAIGLAAFLFVNYVAKPQLDRISKLKTEYADYETKVSIAKAQASPNNKVFVDYKIMNTKIKDATLPLFPIIKQEKIITILNDIFEKNSISPNMYAFSDDAKLLDDIDKNLQAKAEDKTGSTAGESGKTGDNTAKDGGTSLISEIADSFHVLEGINTAKELAGKDNVILAVTVGFSGTYDNIYKAIDAIKNYDKRILITNLSLAKSPKKQTVDGQEQVVDENNISGSMILVFCSLPKIHQQDEEYLKWDFTNPYGKSDPFESALAAAGLPQNTAEHTKADFSMIVSPYSSDLPTVSLGYSAKGGSGQYVYGDNQNFENVEIKLFEKDGKYYHKYMTQSEKYPADYDNGMVEFSPNPDAIRMSVLSYPRKDGNDKSGINLTIINSTRLPFIVTISNDDKASTRIITKQTGSVQINR